MVSIREFLPIYVLSLHTRDTILQSDDAFRNTIPHGPQRAEHSFGFGFPYVSRIHISNLLLP